MKGCFAVLLAAVLIPCTPVLARASKASPLVGSWAVDVSRLPMPPEARPKSVTITFGEASGGKWTTQVDIVDGGGTKSHAVSTAVLDGTAVPITGSTEADIAALRMPTPDVLVMALGRGGIPASTRIYAVAADGKRMVETATYFGDNGRPIMRTNYFTRVK